MHGTLAESLATEPVSMRVKNVIQTLRNMSLDSERNVKSLYVGQLYFLTESQKAVEGEKSFTINNCFSKLDTSLPANQSLSFPRVDIHFYTCHNL